jgi:hypothetical protein
VARAQEGTTTMVEGGDEDAPTPTPSETLLHLLLSPGEQPEMGMHRAGPQGAGHRNPQMLPGGAARHTEAAPGLTEVRNGGDRGAMVSQRRQRRLEEAT